MSEIGIKCIDQKMYFTNTPIITAGNENVDKVRFEFCPLWNNFVKVAIFFKQREAMSYSIVNADGTCDIPNSILKMNGKIYVSVVGINGTDKTRTANILSYEIGDGVIDAVKPEDFPGTEEEATEFYDNILEMCSTMLNAYTLAMEKLDNVYTKEEINALIQSYAYSKTEVDNSIQSAKTAMSTETSDRITAYHKEIVTESLNDITETMNTRFDDHEFRIRALES